MELGVTSRWALAVPSRLALILAIPVLLCNLLAPAPVAGAEPTLASVEALLDAGRPDEAMGLLEKLPRDAANSALALLHRSTARFMLGQTDLGRRDLDEALRKDPKLRQGWLNRAALDIADGQLDRALEALNRARALEPEAPDNDINIGAVLLMQNRIADAQPHLKRYLEANADSADSWYLVASNYALAGQVDAAVAHLQRAIQLDERARLRSRTDPNFATLGTQPVFQQLLNVDSYRIPAQSHAVYRTFDEPYRAGEGKLLPAVLDALQLTGEPFDRQIEVTPDWALIWGEMRIKVKNDPREGGRVELTASKLKFPAEVWKARVTRLFNEITVQLAKR
jgi:tetratricopeptide (TPR) repeat protein